VKIYYIANSRIPTIKAYGLQIVKMCEAFTRAGFDCELVIPRRPPYPGTTEDVLKYYDVKSPFRVTKLYSLDLINIDVSGGINKLLFWIQQFSFALSLKKYLPKTSALIYSRDQFALYLLNGKRNKLIWEAHTLPSNLDSRLYKSLFNKLHYLVVISEGLKREFARYYGGKIVVAPDGVNLEEFSLPISKEEARAKLALPLDRRIVIYVGHLFEWKGADTLVLVAPSLPPEVMVVICGGTDKDIEEIKKLDPQKRVRFEGFTHFSLLPSYLLAADVLVLPNKKDGGISEFYTSPLKLFAYMAARRPIVASDLPSIREILDDQSAFFFKPDDYQSLAAVIMTALNDEHKSETVARNAFEKVQKYTWAERVKKVIQ